MKRPDLEKMAALGRGLQFFCAAALLVAYFQPWATGFGSGTSASHLQERLEGPRRLAAFVTGKGRIARDHRLAGRLWMLETAEAAGLASALWPAAGAWPGFLAGAAAVGIAAWARGEIATYPFQHPGRGVTLTLWFGLGLTAASLLRYYAVSASKARGERRRIRNQA